MAKMHLRIDAGCEHMETMYPCASRGDSRAVKTAKKSLAQQAKDRVNGREEKQRKNDMAAYRKLELELAANYKPGDLIICLTFDDAHLPNSRAGVKAAVKQFTSVLRRYREKHGQTLTYHYREEHKHLSENRDMDGRWHVHMVLNATGTDYKLISTFWGRGRVEIQRLRVDRDKNYESQARYMTKEGRDKVGQRLWSSSRGAKKPQRERKRVGNDAKIKIPRKAIVLSDTGEVETIYGCYRFVRYILPSEMAAAPSGRRKK